LEKTPFCPSSREANIRRYKKILENPPEPQLPRWVSLDLSVVPEPSPVKQWGQLCVGNRTSDPIPGSVAA